MRYMKLSSKSSSYIVLAALAIFVGTALVGCSSGMDADTPKVDVVKGDGTKMKGAATAPVGGGPAPTKATPTAD
jgi:hypothetical protein